MLIVDVLKEAKEFLLKSNKHYVGGMCFCIESVCNQNNIKFTSTYCIKQNIPEFNSLYLAGIDEPIQEYWWDPNDKQSRIEAFDKLINLYKNSNKEWI